MIPRPVIIVAIAVAASLLGDSSLYAILPSYHDQLGIKLGYVGILLSANRLVRLLTNSVAGYIHDSMGQWWHFVVALAVGAFTTAAYGLFWGFFGAFLAARLLWGTCWSFLRLEGYATVIQQAEEHNRGKLMGVYHSITGTGYFVGSLFGGILTNTIGFRNCLLSFAALTLLGALMTFVELSRNRPAGKLKDRNTEGKTTTEPVNRGENEPTERTSAGKNLRHWQIYYASFINLLVNSSIASSTLGLLLKTRLNGGLRLAGWVLKVESVNGLLLAVRWSCSFFFAPVFGHTSDRFGRRFVLRFGLIIGSIAMILMATQHQFLIVAVASILTAIARTAVSAALDASIADVASVGNRGRILSIYTTVTDLGSAIGPIVSYAVSAMIGAQLGLERVYTVGFLLLLSAMFVSVRFKRDRDLVRRSF